MALQFSMVSLQPLLMAIHPLATTSQAQILASPPLGGDISAGNDVTLAPGDGRSAPAVAYPPPKTCLCPHTASSGFAHVGAPSQRKWPCPAFYCCLMLCTLPRSKAPVHLAWTPSRCPPGGIGVSVGGLEFVLRVLTYLGVDAYVRCKDRC